MQKVILKKITIERINIMSELTRHKRAYAFFGGALRKAVERIFNYEYDSLKDIEGPYLLLPNHNLELDPIIIGLITGRQIYFVASEHLTRKGFGTWFLMRYFKPIIHRKGRKGMASSIEMLKTLRSGHSVCLFPEGNRSFNGLTGEIPHATAKLAKKSGAKLVTYRVEGGYLTNPRWSLTIRKGKLKGKLVHVYEPEELKAMTDDQVYEAICQDLFEDAYATQEREMVAFKGKKLALGMESTLYMCPECKRIGMLHSDNTTLSCDCGFQAVYDEYGYLTDTRGKKYTITELDAFQKEYLAEIIADYDNIEPLFADPIKMQEIGEDHAVIRTEDGILTAYTDRLESCGHLIPYSDITGMAIYSRNVLVLYTKSEDRHYEVRSEMTFNALKYLYLYQLIKKN